MARMHAAKFAANYVFQFCTVDKLRDRQSADRNNETRLQNPNLIIHPQSTVANLIRGWNAIAAAGILARKTTANGGEIDLRSNGGFVHSTKLFEPTEECPPGSVRKRPFQPRFPRTGRLPNDHYIADDRAAGDRRRLHARTATAAKKRPYMFVESVLDSCYSHGPMGRSHMAAQLARSDGLRAVFAASEAPSVENFTAGKLRRARRVG
jgi:hypothetical protein